MRRGQPDQAGDGVAAGSRQTQVSQDVEGDARRRVLVVGPGRVVDDVMEPGGQAYEVGIRSGRRQGVDMVENLGEVAQVVIVPVRLCVRPEQLDSDRRRAGDPRVGSDQRRPGRQQAGHD